MPAQRIIAPIKKWRHWLLAAGVVAVAHAAVLSMAWKAHDLGAAAQPQAATVQGFVLAPSRPMAESDTPTNRTPATRSGANAAPASTETTEKAAVWTAPAQTNPAPSMEQASDPAPTGLPEEPPTAPVQATEVMPQDHDTETLALAPSDTPTRLSGFPPSLSHWNYEVTGSSKGFRYQASAVLSWQLNETGYKATMSMRAFLVGTRSQESTGTVGPAGLQPSTFIDQARRERKLVFDWHSYTAQSSESAAPLTLTKGTQDRLSIFLQLSNLLSGLPHTPSPGQRWTLPVAGMNKVEPWVFEWVETSTQHLPAGTFTAWKLKRQPRHNDDQTVEVWFAPSLHHLPVRIRLTSPNGDVVDQQLAHS